MKYILILLLLAGCASDRQMRQEEAMAVDFCLSEASSRASSIRIVGYDDKGQFAFYYSQCMKRLGR